MEEVLEEIREVTLQYTNVDGPVERAARKKRVLQSEIDGSVDETVARIIQAASIAKQLPPPITLSTNQPPKALEDLAMLPSNQTQTSRRRGRPARSRDIQISPKVFKGSSSRKRNVLQGRASPEKTQTSKQTQRNSNGTARVNTNTQSVQPRTTIIPASKRPQLDFPEGHLRLP